ncbi:hypothetical protein N7456_012005 [Penicillium angulare]|uniref:Uncharacterized protein n=1 Tax=Penicillium angulare TaxID=116970 RepID=A0A9W9EUX6_9EURO|nr:hypothetical protein N7456_012005 [Penicillium angulare]
MHLATIAASILALAASGFAAPSPASPANTRYVQLRLFGAPGCFAENLGELGVYGDAVNACQTLGDSTIESVSFEYAINNCTVSVYSDDACQLGRLDIPVNTCGGGDGEYQSYYASCSHLEPIS